jgi:hypothetical protein
MLTTCSTIESGQVMYKGRMVYGERNWNPYSEFVSTLLNHVTRIFLAEILLLIMDGRLVMCPANCFP